METLSEANYLNGNINGNMNSLCAVHVGIHYITSPPPVPHVT